ncbi:cytochrome c oxidase subunit II [Luteimonas sp. A537]
MTGCAGPQSTLDPAGPAAEAIAGIWWAMFWGAMAVWLLVMALVIWALYRGRNTRALAKPQRLIVGGGLVLPPVLLAGLLVYGSLSSARITGLGQEVDARVDVVAGRWRWHFRYYDDDGHVVAESMDVLSMPRGRLVEFRITSADVIHSFWIPRLGGKIDAVPGRVNRLRLRADGEGRIRGQCAEYCGTGHTMMAFEVVVRDDAGHAAWLARQAGAGVPDAVAAADATAVATLDALEPGDAVRVNAVPGAGDAGPERPDPAARQLAAPDAGDDDAAGSSQ